MKKNFTSFNWVKVSALILGVGLFLLPSLVRSQNYQSFDASTTNAWTASKWSTSSSTNACVSSGLSNAFTTGRIAYFCTVNGTGSGSVGITVGGIIATENYTHSSALSTLLTGGTVVTVDVSAGKIFNIGSASISTAAGTGFIKAGSGAYRTGGGAFTGGFTVNAGTMLLAGVNAMGAGGALTLNGGTVAGTATLDLTGKYTGGITIGGDVQFGEMSTVVTGANSTTNLTFSDNISLGSAIRTLTLGNGGTMTFGGIISNTGSNGLTLAANANGTGKFVLSGANTFTGTFTASGATTNLNENSALGSVSSVAIGTGAKLQSGLTTLTDVINNSASVTIAGTGILDLSGGSETIGSLTSASSTASVVIGDFSGTAGSFTVGDATNTTFAGIISGSRATAGSIFTKQGAGTLTLTGANTYTTTLATGLTTITSGILQLSRTGGTTIPVGSNASVTGGTLQISSNQTLNNLTVNGGSVTIDNGITLTVNGTLALTSGTITVGSGTLVIAGATVTRTSGSIDASNASATVIFTNTSALSLPASVFTGNVTNLTMNGVGGVTLGSSVTVTGTATLTSGTLTVGANTLTIGGSTVTRTSGNIDASNASATVIFTNTSALSLPASTFTGTVTNLTMNGAGGVTLGSTVTVTGTTTMTSGKLTLGANNLTIGSSGSITSANSTSYIVTNSTGLLKRSSVASSSVNFPIGTAAEYLPITSFANSGTPDDFGAKVSASAPSCVSAANSLTATWDITEGTSLGSNVALTLQYNSTTASGASYSHAQAKLFHCTGTSPDHFGPAGAALSGSVYTISHSGFTSFSPFGISNDAVLATELTNLTAKSKNGQNLITWQTVTEKNAAHFDIQRATNPQATWQTIGTVKAVGNSQTIKEYEFVDDAPLSISYYRLRSVDFDGKETLSNIVTVISNTSGKLKVYPTFVQDKITISSNSPEPQTFNIYNLLGQNVQTGQLNGQKELIISHLSTGTYFLKAQGETIKFVKN